MGIVSALTGEAKVRAQDSSKERRSDVVDLLSGGVSVAVVAAFQFIC